MKEKYISDVNSLLDLPKRRKAEIIRDLDEIFRSASEHGESESEEGDFLARARHLDCLARACEHLHVLADNAVGRTVGLDIAAEELRLAGNALGEIVGETTPDNLLGMIFSKFCIGK